MQEIVQLRDMPQDGAEPIVRMSGVGKWFGAFQALRNISLDVKRVRKKSFFGGPSGSGKSTLIRCINQLEKIERGQIRVDGVELTESQQNVERIRREVGMVFQQFNLFPHLTVLENCMLAPRKVRNVSRQEAAATARRFLERVKIP